MKNLCPSCTYIGRGEQEKTYCCIYASNPILLEGPVVQCATYIERTQAKAYTVSEQQEHRGNKHLNKYGKVI